MPWRIGDGAYNEVRATLRCPSCDRLVEVDTQFKYGSVVHHRDSIGDRLAWGANDVGRPGYRLVVVDGEASGCTLCSYDEDWPVYVFARSDVLDRVVPATGGYDFVTTHTSFLVLEGSEK